MVAVLGRYASRFSVRAEKLTLDFSLVWFGIGLALIASVFLACIPRLPSVNAPQGAYRRGTRVAGGSSRRLRIFALTQIADIQVVNLLSGGNSAFIAKPPLSPCFDIRENQQVDPFWQHRAVAGVFSEAKSRVYLGFGFLGGGASVWRIGDVDSRTISSGSNITVSGYASVGF
jgi:hypothetical protein